MNLNIKTGLVILVLTLPALVKAQQVFTLQNAIDTALRNNFDIRLAKNDLDIARKSNTYGMAGGLPTVSANAGDNASLTNINQHLSNGIKTSVTNQGENSVTAGLSAGITLFNGFKIVATKERLNQLQQLGELQLNQQVQNTMANVMILYYDIIRQQNYLKIIQNSLEVSRQKLEIVEVKNKVGMADAVEILQSQTDVNSAQQQLEMQKMVIEQNKSDLLLLISSRSKNAVVITDSIVVDPTLQLDPVIQNLDRNPQYLSAMKQIAINEQLVKEVSAQRYPSVKLNAGYDFYQANLNKATLTLNQNYGPSAGISLQVPIFNGNMYKTQKELAQIRVDNSKLEKEQLQSSLSTQAVKLYRSYATALSQIKSQEQNYELSKKLVDVVLQQFHVSQATILDVKAAQSSFENAAYLLVNLQYSAKVAEIELKQLSYSLK